MIRLLLVEDNPGDARMVRELLQEAGAGRFEITHVTKLGEAVRCLGQDGFDAILLDLGLPDAYGLEAVEPIKNAAPATPIVVLSGLQDERVALQAVQNGAQDYLIKGRESGDLLARSIRYAIERKRVERSMNHLAHHDPLTGLPNRRLFLDRLDQAVARTLRNRQILALLFLDVDHFKWINDTLGHEEGDRLLTIVAQRLRASTRASDTVARLGGDEFTVILPEVDRIEDVIRFTEKIFDTLATPFDLAGRRTEVTASMGISLFPADGQDAETLLRNADAAMYRAKQHGGNIHEFFVPAVYVQALKRVALARDLQHALERGQLDLHYQPQVDLRSGTLTGFEALLRWRHPELGLVPAAEFIPVADRTGLVIPISEWVLNSACAQMQAWQGEGLPELGVSVNVTGRELHEGSLVAKTAKVLQDHDIHPHRLGLEFTEGSVLRNQDDSLRAFRDLRQAGISLSIDGFGTGMAPLSHLMRFPFDSLKIDPSLVNGVTNGNDHGASTVRALITMAHTLQLKVVAVGVETPEQVSFLRQHECDRTQGFYFGHPLPAEATTELLRGGLRWGQT